MPENELIIRHKGKDYDIELTEHDADYISDLTAVLEYAPRDPEPPELSLSEMAREAERGEHGKRRNEYQQVAIDFQKQLKRIADLNDYQMPLLLAFLDLMELGELDGSQSNWSLEFIDVSAGCKIDQ
jgi:hypothetical protein